MVAGSLGDSTGARIDASALYRLHCSPPTVAFSRFRCVGGHEGFRGQRRWLIGRAPSQVTADTGQQLSITGSTPGAPDR